MTDREMREASREARAASPGLAREAVTQLPMLVLLVVLWTLLWGQLTPLSVLTGMVVAVIVTRVFVLPPAALPDRMNLWYLLVYLAVVLADLLVASFQVAFLALRPRAVARAALIEVPLVSRSDLVLTLTAITMSIVPGSLAVEVDREESLLYLHVLNTTSPEDVAKAKRNVLAFEARIIRAIGTRDDVRRLRA